MKEKKKNEMPNFGCWCIYRGNCLGCLNGSYVTAICFCFYRINFNTNVDLGLGIDGTYFGFIHKVRIGGAASVQVKTEHYPKPQQWKVFIYFYFSRAGVTLQLRTDKIQCNFFVSWCGISGTGKLRNEKKQNETKRKQNPTKSVK